MRPVVDADQPDVVLLPLDDLVGDTGSRSAWTAAWKTVTSQPRRASSLAARRGTVVPPPESFQPNAVIISLRGFPGGPATRRGARRARDRLGAMPNLGGQPGQRQMAALEAVGEPQQRVALDPPRGRAPPSRSRARSRAAAGVSSAASRIASTSATSAARPDVLIGGVLAVAPDRRQRAAGAVAEAEPRGGAQPEVEVVGQRDSGRRSRQPPRRPAGGPFASDRPGGCD